MLSPEIENGCFWQSSESNDALSDDSFETDISDVIYKPLRIATLEDCFATLDYLYDFSDILNILRRVSINHKQVSLLAPFKTTYIVQPT